MYTFMGDHITVNMCYMKVCGWLGSPVAKALDLQLEDFEFNSQLWCCRVTTLGKLFTSTCLNRLQWFSDGMIDCGVRVRDQSPKSVGLV